GNATLTSASTTSVTSYSDPPNGVQPGGVQALDTGDSRIGSYAYKVGNSIWAVHLTTSSGRSAIRWYQINATTNAITQSGTIGDANHDYIYPSVAVNASGTVVIGFTR